MVINSVKEVKGRGFSFEIGKSKTDPSGKGGMRPGQMRINDGESLQNRWESIYGATAPFYFILRRSFLFL